MAALSSILSLFPRSSPPDTLRSSSFPQRNLSFSFSFSSSSSSSTISIPRSTTSSSNPASPTTAEQPQSNPLIELDFLGPKPGPDGAYPVDRASVISGEKLLRNIMLENKIELYAAYGKVMNCGGVGNCGTCIVEIIEGKDLLNERTNAEKQFLKNKPESWRLACQTIVGNKENSGKVVVQRIPQWKK